MTHNKWLSEFQTRLCSQFLQNWTLKLSSFYEFDFGRGVRKKLKTFLCTNPRNILKKGFLCYPMRYSFKKLPFNFFSLFSSSIKFFFYYLQQFVAYSETPLKTWWFERPNNKNFFKKCCFFPELFSVDFEDQLTKCFSFSDWKKSLFEKKFVNNLCPHE